MAPPKAASSSHWYRWEDKEQASRLEAQREQVQRMSEEGRSVPEWLQWARKAVAESPPEAPPNPKKRTVSERQEKKSPFLSRWTTRVMRETSALQKQLKQHEVKGRTQSDQGFKSAQEESLFPLAVSPKNLFPLTTPVRGWREEQGPLPWGAPVQCIACQGEGVLDVRSAGPDACRVVLVSLTQSCVFQHYECPLH